MAAVRGRAPALPGSYCARSTNLRTAATHLFGRKRVTVPLTVGSFTMTKIVPDPPQAILGKTATVVFGHCKAGDAPMFTVRADIDAEDALVHASLLLKGIYDTLQQTCEFAEAVPKNGLLWASMYSTEMAKGLVDAVLDGLEMKRMGAGG